MLLAKSKRASERLLESSTKYLEERLKLTVNREKSRTVSVFAIRNFKFLGFALGRNGKGIYVRVHPKSWKKFKSRLKELSSRKRCQSIKPSLEKIKVYARGWLNYYGIASMKNNIDDINGWLYHIIRMCIWKQWKLPRTKKRKADKQWILWYSHSLSVCARQLLKPPCTERYARWCERTAVSHRLLLDFSVSLPVRFPRKTVPPSALTFICSTIARMTFFLPRNLVRGIKCPRLSMFKRGHIFKIFPMVPEVLEILPPLM